MEQMRDCSFFAALSIVFATLNQITYNVDLCSSTTEDTLDSNVDAATKVVTNPINFGG